MGTMFGAVARRVADGPVAETLAAPRLASAIAGDVGGFAGVLHFRDDSEVG